MEESPPNLRASGRRFVSWGRSNAQLLGVGFVLVGAIYYVGGAIRELQTQRELYETKLEKQEEKAVRDKMTNIVQPCKGYSLLQVQKYRAALFMSSSATLLLAHALKGKTRLPVVNGRQQIFPLRCLPDSQLASYLTTACRCCFWLQHGQPVCNNELLNSSHECEDFLSTTPELLGSDGTLSVGSAWAERRLDSDIR
ncbi:hypothetical protein WJX82_008280 [Trebouxia sp. C0006]